MGSLDLTPLLTLLTIVLAAWLIVRFGKVSTKSNPEPPSILDPIGRAIFSRQQAASTAHPVSANAEPAASAVLQPRIAPADDRPFAESERSLAKAPAAETPEQSNSRSESNAREVQTPKQIAPDLSPAGRNVDHHLQMADSYLDDAEGFLDNALDAKEKIEGKLKKAAQHLNAARGLRPTKKLRKTTEKGEEYELTQDYLSGKLLLIEGIMYHGVALDIAASDPSMLQKAKGTVYLQQSVTTLERALEYQPFGARAAALLTFNWELLANKNNAIKYAKIAVEKEPDNIEYHKKFEEVSDPDFDPLPLLVADTWGGEFKKHLPKFARKAIGKLTR